jgi:uncharacterized membrane protein (DUF4010 family)
MNEIEPDYLAAKAMSLGAVALLLKLWLIVMVVFIGLWVLGVILMYWYVIIPASFVVVWWTSSSSSTTTGDSSS